jgi:DNA-binding winged helix-turn-helix (wHTH) protein
MHFDGFQLRLAERQLLVDGAPAKLGSRAFDVLAALVERRGRTVSKNELLEIVWPDVVVEENNLQVQVSALRKLLGAKAIATIPGRGYRFTAALVDQPQGSEVCAAACASTVLPMPAAPSTVTSGCASIIAINACSSASRPISGGPFGGRLPGASRAEAGVGDVAGAAHVAPSGRRSSLPCG